jgi:hypothetical protein
MSLPASKPTRNADLQHRQSLGRQRKHAGAVSPHEQAEAIAKIVRARIADQQPVPDLDHYNLTDATWGELLVILDADELTAVGDAAGGDDTDDMANEPGLEAWTTTPEDDTIPPAPSHTPSWHDHEPVFVHSLKWHDADGVEHLHVVRSDDLDEMLRQVKTIKVCIAAAKARDKAQAIDAKEESSTSPRRCLVHDTEMTRRVSKKTGKTYSAHDTAEGLCFGRKA